MTIAEQIITIAMCTLGTMAMRFLPFLVFRQDKSTPKYIQYLGKVLPRRNFRNAHRLLSAQRFRDGV